MPKIHTIPADTSQWSEKSKQSVAYLFRHEYTDKPYKCCSCGISCIYTAEDQKYTYEVKKASIDQQRVLCHACWSESNRLQLALKKTEAHWAGSKKELRINEAFLSEWLDLLMRLEHYIRYKPDTAKKNMLKKLLQQLMQPAK